MDLEFFLIAHFTVHMYSSSILKNSENNLEKKKHNLKNNYGH